MQEVICELQVERYIKGKEIDRLNNIISELEKYIEDKIYTIEPRGTGIIYNCEYDSEDDYIDAMREQSRLNTLKEDLNKLKELKEKE